MVLDVFSKYGWIVPLKDKKGETVVKAFKSILQRGYVNQNIFGLIKGKSITTNMLRNYLIRIK